MPWLGVMANRAALAMGFMAIRAAMAGLQTETLAQLNRHNAWWQLIALACFVLGWGGGGTFGAFFVCLRACVRACVCVCVCVCVCERYLHSN